MSETKLEAKQWAHSENFRYHSENLALRKFRNVCEIFSLCLIAKFFDFFYIILNFFFLKSNKIINKENKNKNNKIIKIKIKTFF